MTRRAPLLLVLVATLSAVLPLAVVLPAGDVGAQPSGSPASRPGFEITTVSPWVEADGDFEVRFAPTSTVPADSELTWTIHQSLVPDRDEDLRQQVRSIIDGESAGRILQSSVTVPVAELGDPAEGAALRIPIRSERSSSERVLLPNPGIHPVDLVLTAADGTVLWTEVVFLNRLPDPGRRGIDPSEEPLRVSLLLPLESPPAIAPDGSAAISASDRETIERAGSLLEEVPDAPLIVGARANTLDALSAVEESWAARVIDALGARRRAVGGAGGGVVANELLNRPYVGVDSGGLVAAGGADELGRQLLLGSGTVTDITGRIPVRTTYGLDETVSPESLPIYAGAGAESLLVPRSRLDLESADDVDEHDLVTAPMTVLGGGGMQVLAYDDDLAALLTAADVDPGMRAHHTASVLMSSWFDGRDDGTARRRAAAIVLPSTTDPEVLDALTPMLTTPGGPLVADPSGNALAAPTPDDPGVEIALAPRTAPDQDPALVAVAESRRQLEAYRSMGGGADPSLVIWEDLNDESLAASLDATERETLHATIRAGIAGNLAAIETPRTRSVVVTSQASVIPLRFRNGLPFEVTLTLRARSPRLDIEGGESREIVLAPGENRIDLPVEVQAPGESLLRIEVSVPDGGLALPTTAIPVRSTAVSGVGAALSILSILFLAGWWLHTHRRARRQQAGTAGTHPSSTTDHDDDTSSVGAGG
ncbi:MAG: DUF6049 family protein [Actinomycetota bacterium]|nr:DUF6049 family protein [Actinomycetota bacterium]